MRVEASGTQVRRYSVTGISAEAYDELIKELDKLIRTAGSPVANHQGRWMRGDEAALVITVASGCTVEQVDQAVRGAMGL